MKLELSANSPRNTILRTPEGQEIYRIVTPRKLGKKVTTITKIVPNSNDMHDKFAHLAEIVWPVFEKNTVRFQGFEVPAESYLSPDGLFRCHRVFQGPDGRRYRWYLGPFGTSSPTLQQADETKKMVAKFHQKCFFSSFRSAFLEIAPEGEHMADQIVITFILVEKLRRDRERRNRGG